MTYSNATALLATAVDMMQRPHESTAAWQARTGCQDIGDAIARIDSTFAQLDARREAEAAEAAICKHPRRTAGGTCLDCFAR